MTNEATKELQQLAQQALQDLPDVYAYGRLVGLEEEDYRLRPTEIQKAIDELQHLEGRKLVEAIEMTARLERITDRQLADLLQKGAPEVAVGGGAARFAQQILSHPQAGRQVARTYTNMVVEDEIEGLDKLFVGFIEEDQRLADQLLENPEVRQALAQSSNPLVLEKVLAHAQDISTQKLVFRRLAQHESRMAERLLYDNWREWKEWVDDQTLQNMRGGQHEALEQLIASELGQRQRDR